MMTRYLDRRIMALEGPPNRTLSPAAKVWLGLPLTAAEQHRLDGGVGSDVCDTLDTTNWSTEAKTWLGID